MLKLFTHPQSGFDIVSELFLVHRHIVLAQPVAVQDWSLESSISVNVGEILQTDCIHLVIGPHTLLIFNQTVLKYV